jgi:transcriptional regulator with XRE-family HTH domain
MSAPAIHLRTAEPSEHSPLASARLQRKLTVEQLAMRSGLSREQVVWLEEGRVYRFPSTDEALVAVVLYASALGIDAREARELAGLPVPPAPPSPVPRILAGATAGAILLAVLLIALFTGGFPGTKSSSGPPLSPPWKVSVDVLNGSGDINYTRTLASRVGALGYRIERVTKANRFDYRETAVYYEPGGDRVCNHLADLLDVPSRPLPGGKNPRRCVVIAGPARGPG